MSTAFRSHPCSKQLADGEDLDALEQPYESRDESSNDLPRKCFYVYPHDEELKRVSQPMDHWKHTAVQCQAPFCISSLTYKVLHVLLTATNGANCKSLLARKRGISTPFHHADPSNSYESLDLFATWYLWPGIQWLLLNMLSLFPSALSGSAGPQKFPKLVLEVSSLGFRLLRPETGAPMGLYSWGQIHSWAHAPNDFAFRHFDERWGLAPCQSQRSLCTLLTGTLCKAYWEV